MSLEETLRLNKIQRQNERLRQKHYEKKQAVKETILAVFIGLFIVAICVISISNLTSNAIASCSKVHDVNYCERKLR